MVVLLLAAVVGRNGLAGALFYACWVLIVALVTFDTGRTGVAITAYGNHYHRGRQPRRYWSYLIFFGALTLLLGFVGAAAVVRDGVDAFAPSSRKEANRLK